MILRPETLNDIDAIRELTRIAFLGKPYSDGTEQDVIDGLRADQALTLSIVADDAGEIVGHIAYSSATVDGHEGWYTLGPISVAPKRQKSGIGSQLIDTTLPTLRETGALGVLLLGDPGYYGRFGFAVNPKLTWNGAASPYLQSLPLNGTPPEGAIVFHPAFGTG